MSDLCAPVYVVMDADEELTFWCFVEFMNRMVRYLSVYSQRHIRFIAMKLETKLPS
jgi:hypothetical protein